MIPPVLDYASPARPSKPRQIHLSVPFMFAQSLSFAIGFFIYFWVMSDNGFGRLLTCPIAGIIGVVQFFIFTLSGWTTILTRSMLPWWAKGIGVIATAMGSALSLSACFIGFSTAHGC